MPDTCGRLKDRYEARGVTLPENDAEHAVLRLPYGPRFGHVQDHTMTCGLRRILLGEEGKYRTLWA